MTKMTLEDLQEKVDAAEKEFLVAHDEYSKSCRDLADAHTKLQKTTIVKLVKEEMMNKAWKNWTKPLNY